MDYCDKADLYSSAGKQNIIQYSDLDDTGVEDTARIADAITRASRKIDSRFRKSKYSLPLIVDGGSEVLADVDLVIRDICADLASVWLYENRGVQDYDPDTGAVTHRLTYINNRAMAEINDILADQSQLEVAVDAGAAPVNVA